MSVFTIVLAPRAAKTVATLKRKDRVKLRKVEKTLALLAEYGDRAAHPSLQSHHIDSTIHGVSRPWQSHVENNCPAAWRMWWHKSGPNELTILAVGPHPK